MTTKAKSPPSVATAILDGHQSAVENALNSVADLEGREAAITPPGEMPSGTACPPTYVFVLPNDLRAKITDEYLKPPEFCAGPRIYFQDPQDNPPQFGDIVIATMKSDPERPLPWRVEEAADGTAMLLPCFSDQEPRPPSDFKIIGVVTDASFPVIRSGQPAYPKPLPPGVFGPKS